MGCSFPDTRDSHDLQNEIYLLLSQVLPFAVLLESSHTSQDYAHISSSDMHHRRSGTLWSTYA